MAQCERCGQQAEGVDRVCGACLREQNQPTATFTPVLVGESSLPSAESSARPFTLTVTKGPQVGDYFSLSADRTSIGRNPEADIFLNDQTVSRDHAEILKSENVTIVRDRGSLNGTYLNGTIVEEAGLRDGDRIQIGTFQLTFRQGS